MYVEGTTNRTQRIRHEVRLSTDLWHWLWALGTDKLRGTDLKNIDSNRAPGKNSDLTNKQISLRFRVKIWPGPI